jgi:hypothetical protein
MWPAAVAIPSTLSPRNHAHQVQPQHQISKNRVLQSWGPTAASEMAVALMWDVVLSPVRAIADQNVHRSNPLFWCECSITAQQQYTWLPMDTCDTHACKLLRKCMPERQATVNNLVLKASATDVALSHIEEPPLLAPLMHRPACL